MKQEKRPKVLVVSRSVALAELTRKAAGETVEVHRAQNRAEAREKVREVRPDLVVVGGLEPPDSAAELCTELRQGWIARHSSVVVVDRGGAESVPCPGSAVFAVSRGEYDALTGASGSPPPEAPLSDRLKETIDRALAQRTNRLKAAIGAGRFCLVWEQIPGRGAFEARQEFVLENAGLAAAGGRVCAISVTDNPGGNPAIATEILSREIRQRGVEPLVHVAFRDRSRNQCESLLYQLAAMDINNVLALTGDYPSNAGFRGRSRPVFDLDSVNGIELIAEMNRGMEHEMLRRSTRLAPTDFFAGVAFSPFKQEEAEVMGQYAKLQKKIAAGADFIVTQVGYDIRKLDELRLWLKAQHTDVPVLASIYVLPLATARAMNANRVPGCVVTDALVARIAAEAEAPDKGRQARLERAARMYALIRGMGFAGASIGGFDLPYAALEYILGRGEELRRRWEEFIPEFNYPQKEGFYLYEAEGRTGLNRESVAVRRQKPARSAVYSFSRLVHGLLFEPAGPLFRLMRRLAARVDALPVAKRVFGACELLVKTVLYGCANCGDCALFDVAYLCPVSQCPKNQRNGPCGGSFEGWCEVYPNEKKCIWVRAYRRLKAGHREEGIGAVIVPPCNWELWQTPSWLNYFLGRDYLSRRLGIRPPE